MSQRSRFSEHHLYHVLMILVLIFGFVLMYLFSAQLIIQFVILLAVLIAYMGMGFIHHHFNHDLRAKIVLEYILISLLILGAFLFLNAGRL